MTFKKLSENKLKILLSQDDMLQLALCYDKLDCDDEQTRAVLLTLMELAATEADFFPYGEHLLVEAYPTESGGCVLYLTAVGDDGEEEEYDYERSVCPCVIYQFDDYDCLADACAALFDSYSHCILKSTLYHMNGRFFLSVFPLDHNRELSVVLLGEYGTLYSRGVVAEAFLQEHGLTIVKDEAIEKIAYHSAPNTQI